MPAGQVMISRLVNIGRSRTTEGAHSLVVIFIIVSGLRAQYSQASSVQLRAWQQIFFGCVHSATALLFAILTCRSQLC